MVRIVRSAMLTSLLLYSLGGAAHGKGGREGGREHVEE